MEYVTLVAGGQDAVCGPMHVGPFQLPYQQTAYLFEAQLVNSAHSQEEDMIMIQLAGN